jgi:hypothetical protein
VLTQWKDTTKNNKIVLEGIYILSDQDQTLLGDSSFEVASLTQSNQSPVINPKYP